MNSPLRRIIKQLHCSQQLPKKRKEERLTTAPRFEDAFVTPTVVPTDGLTDEEREHIERVMKMAQQSSFEQGVMQQQTMPEPVEELEPVEIFVNQEPQVSFQDDRSSATSGADADRSFDAEYGQSFESYGQAAPLLTTTAEEEEGLATASRFEDAFVTPTVVPTEDGQQSSFEQGVMQGKTMPEPVEELEPVEISPRLGLTLIAHLTPIMNSPLRRIIKQLPAHNNCRKEERLTTAPRFEDAFVTPTVVPTMMAQQSSFEQGVMQQQTMPEPVEELEPVEIFVNQEPQVSFQDDRSSATSGADADGYLTLNMDSPSNPMVGSSLLTTTAEEEEGLATAPRFEDAFMAQQSSFEQGVMQGKTMPEPVEELEPVEIFMNQESQVSFEEDRSSATSGADADRSFDAEYGQSFESYAPRFEDAFVTPTVVPTDGLTDEEREHIERVMKMAQQSSFEQGVMQGKTMPEPVEELEIFMNQESQVSFEEDRSSATSGADADRSFDAEYGQSFASYNQAAPLLTTTAEEEGRGKIDYSSSL
ncbi:hypothetical protein L596_005242 [Steinernema carpocapsae]|uniref:Uncharacterized protein n=1 Tax=Steinernema carpocapsae TaxID=34508 RepID=A0A4U8UZY7_STECR|nr:hypothetical protein L596_005242 [Steinernema carpocapsae]